LDDKERELYEEGKNNINEKNIEIYIITKLNLIINIKVMKMEKLKLNLYSINY